MTSNRQLPPDAKVCTLSQFASEFCFGDRNFSFEEGLSSVWHEISRKGIIRSYIYSVGFFVAFCNASALLISFLLSGLKYDLLMHASLIAAIIAVALYFLRLDRGLNFFELRKRAGDQKTSLMLFEQLLEFLKNEQIVAFREPIGSQASTHQPVPTSYWNADFGWRALFGIDRLDSIPRIISLWSNGNRVVVNLDDIQEGDLADAYWLVRAYHHPDSLKSYPLAKLHRMKQLMTGLLGPSEIDDRAFKSLEIYAEAFEQGLSDGKAKAKAAGKDQKEGARGSTASRTVDGSNQAFIKRIEGALGILLSRN